VEQQVTREIRNGGRCVRDLILEIYLWPQLKYKNIKSNCLYDILKYTLWGKGWLIAYGLSKCWLIAYGLSKCWLNKYGLTKLVNYIWVAQGLVNCIWVEKVLVK
jgi:hypothetical protein